MPLKDTASVLTLCAKRSKAGPKGLHRTKGSFQVSQNTSSSRIAEGQDCPGQREARSPSATYLTPDLRVSSVQLKLLVFSEVSPAPAQPFLPGHTQPCKAQQNPNSIFSLSPQDTPRKQASTSTAGTTRALHFLRGRRFDLSALRPGGGPGPASTSRAEAGHEAPLSTQLHTARGTLQLLRPRPPARCHKRGTEHRTAPRCPRPPCPAAWGTATVAVGKPQRSGMKASERRRIPHARGAARTAAGRTSSARARRAALLPRGRNPAAAPHRRCCWAAPSGHAPQRRLFV